MKIFIIFLTVSLSLWSENIANQNDFNKTKENLLYLSYEKKPERIYVNQIFKVKLKAIVATTNFNKIITNFNGYRSLTILNRNNSWKWYNDNIYYNTFYFKALSANTKFPKILISLSNNGKIIASQSLNEINPEIIKLKQNKDFSGVIAENLEVVKSKATQFNQNSNILVLEITGKNANLRDFHIANVIKDGIDSFDINLPKSKIYYFAIIPKNENTFKFSYFNTIQNRYMDFSIPITVVEDAVSTQLELNPKESKMYIYENIFLLAIAFLFLILFYFKRKKRYIFVFLCVVGYLIVFYNPFDDIILPKGTKITILPIYNSIVFDVTNRKIVAEKLDSISKYIKILLPNGKIGWVRKDALK